MKRLSKVLLGAVLTTLLATGCGAKELTKVTDTDELLHFEHYDVYTDATEDDLKRYKEYDEELKAEGLKEIGIEVYHGDKDTKIGLTTSESATDYIGRATVFCDGKEYTDHRIKSVWRDLTIKIPYKTKKVEINYIDAYGGIQKITIR